MNKFKASAVIFFLIFNFCFAQEKKAKGITFEIIGNFLKNSSSAKLLIINNSSNNNYLPILIAPDNEKWKFMLPTNETSFFFGNIIAYNSSGKYLMWHSHNCYDGDVEMVWKDFDEKWIQKKKNIKIEDFVLLKAGQRKIINVPINLQIKLSNECFWEIRDYKKEKQLKVSYYYRKKQAEWAPLFLNAQILEKLDNLNYKLYDMEIESNKVKVIF